MRADTKRRIAEALEARPHTRDQLIAITGLSRATIVNAVRDMGLEKIAGSRPVYYIMPMGYQTDKEDYTLPVTSSAVDTIRVGYQPRNNWMSQWEENRNTIGSNIANLVILPRSNPNQILEKLTKYTEILASLAVDLHKVRGDPQWYQQLGGR